jgi:IS5 family transposase
VRSVDQQLSRLGASRRTAATKARAALRRIIPLGQQVVRQARLRLFRGITDSAGKLISVFAPYAQILRRGKLHKPTEFGVMAKVQEADGGIVTDIRVVPEKMDAPLLVPSVEKHIAVFGKAPWLVATDRGFYSTEGERGIHALGVKRAVVPKPGYRSESRKLLENERWFRRGRAWRAGGEARISRLKRRFGMARTPNRTTNGMQRTVVWAGIANNLAVMAR